MVEGLLIPRAPLFFFGLIVLPVIITPLVGDELASRIPGTDVVLAEESQGGGG